jgi:hypothetical protein
MGVVTVLDVDSSLNERSATLTTLFMGTVPCGSLGRCCQL